MYFLFLYFLRSHCPEHVWRLNSSDFTPSEKSVFSGSADDEPRLQPPGDEEELEDAEEEDGEETAGSLDSPRLDGGQAPADRDVIVNDEAVLVRLNGKDRQNDCGDGDGGGDDGDACTTTAEDDVSNNDQDVERSESRAAAPLQDDVVKDLGDVAAREG